MLMSVFSVKRSSVGSSKFTAWRRDGGLLAARPSVGLAPLATHGGISCRPGSYGHSWRHQLNLHCQGQLGQLCFLPKSARSAVLPAPPSGRAQFTTGRLLRTLGSWPTGADLVSLRVTRCYRSSWSGTGTRISSSPCILYFALVTLLLVRHAPCTPHFASLLLGQVTDDSGVVIW